MCETKTMVLFALFVVLQLPIISQASETNAINACISLPVMETRSKRLSSTFKKEGFELCNKALNTVGLSNIQRRDIEFKRASFLIKENYRPEVAEKNAYIAMLNGVKADENNIKTISKYLLYTSWLKSEEKSRNIEFRAKITYDIIHYRFQLITKTKENHDAKNKYREHLKLASDILELTDYIHIWSDFPVSNKEIALLDRARTFLSKPINQSINATSEERTLILLARARLEHAYSNKHKALSLYSAAINMKPNEPLIYKYRSEIHKMNYDVEFMFDDLVTAIDLNLMARRGTRPFNIFDWHIMNAVHELIWLLSTSNLEKVYNPKRAFDYAKHLHYWDYNRPHLTGNNVSFLSVAAAMEAANGNYSRAVQYQSYAISQLHQGDFRRKDFLKYLKYYKENRKVVVKYPFKGFIPPYEIGPSKLSSVKLAYTLRTPLLDALDQMSISEYQSALAIGVMYQGENYMGIPDLSSLLKLEKHKKFVNLGTTPPPTSNDLLNALIIKNNKEQIKHIMSLGVDPNNRENSGEYVAYVGGIENARVLFSELNHIPECDSCIFMNIMRNGDGELVDFLLSNGIKKGGVWSEFGRDYTGDGVYSEKNSTRLQLLLKHNLLNPSLKLDRAPSVPNKSWVYSFAEDGQFEKALLLLKYGANLASSVSFKDSRTDYQGIKDLIKQYRIQKIYSTEVLNAFERRLDRYANSKRVTYMGVGEYNRKHILREEGLFKNGVLRQGAQFNYDNSIRYGTYSALGQAHGKTKLFRVDDSIVFSNYNHGSKTGIEVVTNTEGKSKLSYYKNNEDITSEYQKNYVNETIRKIEKNEMGNQIVPLNKEVKAINMKLSRLTTGGDSPITQTRTLQAKYKGSCKCYLEGNMCLHSEPIMTAENLDEIMAMRKRRHVKQDVCNALYDAGLLRSDGSLEELLRNSSLSIGSSSSIHSRIIAQAQKDLREVERLTMVAEQKTRELKRKEKSLLIQQAEKRAQRTLSIRQEKEAREERAKHEALKEHQEWEACLIRTGWSLDKSTWKAWPESC